MFFSIFTGCPAIPAIRLDGHAMCMHRPQILIMAIGIWVIIIMAVMQYEKIVGVFKYPIIVIYPLVAFIPWLRDLFHLFAGHLAEISIAGVFIWRGLTGKAVQNVGDRIASGILGWFLIFRNGWLFFSISFFSTSRAKYYSHGSFGLDNDLVRIARDYFSLPVSAIAIPLMILTILVPVLAYLIAIRTVPKSQW